MNELQSATEAARALTSIPVLSTLSPVDRAKLAGVLEDRWLDAGTVVFKTGVEGDALYILREGTAERRVAGTAIDQIQPPGFFGELALVTDLPRSASVVAVTPIRVWVLPRERFHPLLRGEPGLMLALMSAIGLDLARTRSHLAGLRRELDAWVEGRLRARTAEDRALIEAAALFERPPLRLLAELAATDVENLRAHLGALGRRTRMLHEEGDELLVPAAVRRSVLDILNREHRDRAVAARVRTAAESLERQGYVEEAVRGYRAAGAHSQARAALEKSAPTAHAGSGAAAVPSVADEGPPPAIAADAGRTGVRLDRRQVLWLAVALLPLLAWNTTPPSGLSPEGWRALLGLLAAGVLFASEALPETAVALGLLALWGAGGLVAPGVALAGFASETWLLVLTVLAVGVGVGNSGLLYRLALAALGTKPRGFAWRCMSLALVGVAVTPTLPNATSRMALAAPMVREIAEALGYEPGGRQASGLALAALVGFGQMSALFLTGASVGLLVHGLLPPAVRAEFNFAGWLLAALPLHVVLFGLSMLGVVLLHRPKSASPDAGDRLALQRAVLGPMRGAEVLCTIVLALLIVGFVSEPWHGVAAAWLGVGAFVVLAAGRVLDANMIRTGVNWPFLVFFGVITGLAGVFRELGIDEWLALRLAEPLSLLAGRGLDRGLLFCLVLTLTGFALSFVVRWQAAAPLLTLVALPSAATAGVNPFLIGLLALVSTQMWFLPYQSTVYQALYHGTGDLFAHRNVRVMAWLWGPLVLVATLAAVPMWRAMGYLE